MFIIFISSQKIYIDELTKSDSSAQIKTIRDQVQERKKKKTGECISFIEPNGKRIESDIKCNTIITTLNISWDYCSRRIFLRFGFNWFFARISKYTHTRNHKYFHPKYWGIESSQAQVHSLNSPYAMRCDRVYIIKLKYDVHKKAQQHTNNKWT